MSHSPIHSLVAFCLIAVAAACTSVTPYQAERAGYGYTAPVIEDDIYKVTFRGNAHTSRSLVEDYLLLRMAELTRDEGLAHFSVQEQGTDCFITVRTSPTSECTIHRSHTEVFPYYSIERDPRWFWQNRSKKEFEAIAFFKMIDAGPEGAGGHVYAVSEVIERLNTLKD
jgi:hypothetical protein